jgi:hypothetical protein
MGKVLTENKGNYFDESVRNIFVIILNDKLKKMYYWFHKIEIKRIAYSSIDGQPYFAINGDIYVDEDWGGFQWREYQGQKPMTYPGDELSFGEIIGEDLSRELRDTFFKIIGAITGKKFKYTSFSWINTHLVEPKNDLQEQRIIEEETKMNIRLRRRLGMLDYEIESKMRAVYRPDNICENYRSGDELVEVVMEAAIDSMYWNYFADTDDNSGDWVNMYYDMVKYIREKYGEKIKEYYHINCGN